MKVRLGDYIEQIRGVSYSPTDLHKTLDKNAVILLRANNIAENKINFTDVVYVDRERVLTVQFFQEGDILVCASSGSKQLVGKAAYISQSANVTFGAFCKIIRPKVEVKRYIGYFFESPYYRKRISELSMGANINNIRNEHIDNLVIELPEICSQKVICAELDKLSELIEKRKQQLKKLDLLVKSQFIEMFEKGQQYEETSFGDICLYVRNGANIKQTKGAGGYPITRIETLSNDVFNSDRLGYADITDLSRYTNYLLKKGDILISHINSVAYLGRAVQYRGEVKSPVIHGMNLLCARIKEGYNPTYIEWCLKSKRAKDYIATITKKAVNQASITTSDLKKMAIPVPPKEEQDQFAYFVEQTDKSKFAIKQSLEKLETLKKALMQKYFG